VSGDPGPPGQAGQQLPGPAQARLRIAVAPPQSSPRRRPRSFHPRSRRRSACAAREVEGGDRSWGETGRRGRTPSTTPPR
jgi:hypothetical protein